MAKKFCRGLNEESFNKIKEFFDTELGQKIKKAQIERGRYKGQPGFNTCIRENYINIYWQGCSVLKYSQMLV